MRVIYPVLGVVGIVFGILNMCGVEVITPFAAGSYAVTAGLSFLGEAIEAGRNK